MSTLAVQLHGSEKLLAFEDFFWLPNFVFKCAGWDILQTTSTLTLKHLLNVLLAILMVLHIFVGYYTLKQASEMLSSDFLAVLRLLPYLSYFMDCNIKSITFWLNLKRIRYIMRILRELYPNSAAEQRVYRLHKYYMSKIVRMLICFFFISCYTVIILPILDSALRYLYARFMLAQHEAVFDYVKVYPGMTYFFDYRTPVGYILVIIFEESTAHLRVAINTAGDLWLILLAAQICMHLEHVARTLEAYDPAAMEDASQRNAFINNLIRRHQVLLSLQKDLNAVFSLSLTFNLVSTIVLLCATAVQLVLHKWEFLSFLVFSIFKFYLICAAGENLITAGYSVATAAYNSKWYNGAKTYRKQTLLLILRAQRETSLVPKGAQAICLETLKIVLSMTYQVFTLLQTMLD